MTVREFLTSHDLAAYADAFEARRVAMIDLASMSEDDLRDDLGIESYQDRKRFRVAVAALSSGGPSRPTAPPVVAAPSAAAAVPATKSARGSIGVKLGFVAVGVLALVGVAACRGGGESDGAPTPVSVPGSDFQSPTLGAMKWIPAGTFLMGSPSSESGRGSDETQHSVTLTKGYWLMEHEVTQGEWESVIGSNPSRFTDCGPTCPVEQVSWDDAVAFAQKASARDGVTYTLPTEAQWEYAARGGQANSQQTIYASESELGAVGWTSDNSGSTTHAVCGKARNGYGLCDMTGNVREWTSDWSGDYAGNVTDPTGAPEGSARVFRGDSWRNAAGLAWATNRDRDDPLIRYGFLGFRLSRTNTLPSNP